MGTTTPKILAFSGSARKDSLNQQLVKVAANGAAAAGAEITVINLGDFDLPIFNQDLEVDGRPENVTKLKEAFEACDGFLIASPEYNSSFSPLLKNAIDWVSRPDEGKPPLSCFKGKVAGIMAASPGGLGGLRGLVHVRAVLGNIGVTVVPDQMAISKAHEAFDESGNLKDEKLQGIITGIGKTVARFASCLSTS